MLVQCFIVYGAHLDDRTRAQTKTARVGRNKRSVLRRMGTDGIGPGSGGTRNPIGD